MNKLFIPPHIFLEMGSWRQPLLMVDRINNYQYGEKGFIKVIKHVTYNEPYIPGHFPDNPIMPGAIISEIFGQASEYLSFLSDICEIYHERYGISLQSLRDICSKIKDDDFREIIRARRAQVQGVLAAQNIKFKGIAYPGDTLEVTSQLAFSDNNGFKHYSVCAHVGKKVISKGTIINYREVK
ncbi:beta-hydroxyacyl-ACP dehydratase [Pantoea alhagi]|uniref:3-hydroxyacyl-ACP dehydratase FabZ family protein n=1 Tax=Pantoea alhagi TaxID=1891675 RepID=UPI00202AF90A|nr:3-hydroxyacyl-ACP dehydratase FabZ family protein [Pantoea alhagi]URQ62120.1 beta-hydroxyacyl-ACP dehydratase [Pantoea alhagi]